MTCHIVYKKRLYDDTSHDKMKIFKCLKILDQTISKTAVFYFESPCPKATTLTALVKVVDIGTTWK